MPNILSTGDIHFGLKSHSDQLPDGFTSAEKDAIQALESFLNRASQPDVDILIFTGDITHTNHPTSLVVAFLTDYFNRLNALGKPIFIIPGNHDRSNYSYSFEFLDSDHLKNVRIISEGTYCETFYGISIYFVPFVFGSEFINKYNTVQETIRGIIEKDSKRKIIVSHFQESSSVAGSEASMISKSVEVMNMDSVIEDCSYTMLLLGHIHFYQVYKKSNGLTVCYTGNPYAQDKTDSNQQKGFVLVNTENFQTTFVPVTGIRRFNKIKTDSKTNAIDYLKSIRLIPNTIHFIENTIKTITDKINIDEVNEYLKPFNNKAVEVKNTLEEISDLVNSSNTAEIDYYEYFKKICEANYKEELSLEDFELLIALGIKRLEAGLS